MDPKSWFNSNIYGYGFEELLPQEKDAINYFCVLWSMCEANCFSKDGNPSIIDAYVASIPDKDIEFSNFREDFIYFKNRYYDGLEFNSMFDALFRKGPKEKVANIISNNSATDKDKLLALILITNRLRNNYMHGEKWAYKLAGQLDNFSHANNVLMNLLELNHKITAPAC